MLKFEPNAHKHQDIDAETKKMRPYKKRSFYNRPQSNESSMDIENSDDSEKQVSPPPATDNVDKEKGKDKEGEIKNRIKWQRKTSRKQFRHHTIEVFRPREYPSTTLLKQKDSSPTHSKKPDAASKESITESIVSSLGGQKAFAQKLIRAIDGILKNDDDKHEENNNTNGTQNNNNVGKHQLPAIIMETPLARRRSLENNSLPKPNFVKNADEANTKKIHHDRSFSSKIPVDMPLLQLADATEDVSSSNRDAQSEDSQAESEPPQDTVMDAGFSNSALSDSNADPGVQGLENVEVSGRIAREDTILSRQSSTHEKVHAFDEHRVPGQNHGRHLDSRDVAHFVQEQQTAEQMETEYPLEEQPENLSLKRRYSTEVPVDLSKKSIATQIRQIESLNDFQKDHQRPGYANTVVNGAFNESSPIESTRPPSNYFQSNREIARNPFEEPANHQSVRKESNSYKSSDYSRYDVAAFQKSYAENFASFTRKTSSDTTKTPPPYTKEYPAHAMPHNILAERLVKIDNLNRWRDALQLLLGQQFNAQVLDSMSLAYRQLDTIKDEAYVPAEVRSKAQKVLTETYDFISRKLKRHFGSDLNPTDVIKILGQTEANAEKNTLQSDLENIQRITHLDLNDAPPPVPPSINHHFALQQDKYIQQNYRELPKTPPSPYMNNFISPRHQTANTERHFSKIPSPVQPDPHQRIDRPPLEINKQSVPMSYHRMHHVTKPSDHPMHPVSPLSGSENSIQFVAPTYSHLGYMKYPLKDMRGFYAYQADVKDHIPKTHSSGRPRSKSHRNTEVPGGQHQLKRSISNPHNVPMEKNYLGHPYIDNSRAPQARIPTYRLPPNTVPQNLLQFGDLSITPSSVMQKPPPYSTVVHQNPVAKDVIKYRHSFPEYPKKVHNNLRSTQSLVLNGNQTPGGSSNMVPQKVLDVHKPHTTNHIEDKISSTTDHLGVLRPQVYDEKNTADSRSVKPKEKSKTVPAVIVADTSMQITKEPTLPSKDNVIRQEAPEESDVRMTVITSSSENASSSEESLKQAIEKDQDENNSEFLVWLEKLKSNEKLKSKFLSQMGIIKKEEPTFVPPNDCIEIIDSDEEKPVESDTDTAKVTAVITPVPKEPHQTASRPPSHEPAQPEASASTQEKNISQENNATITIPRTLEITPVPLIQEGSKSIKTPTLKPSLSKLDYIPPIALPYVPTSTVYGEKYPPRDQPKKTIYSPEIEPISPVGNEPSFAFPEVPTATKIPLAVNADERGVVLREKVSSPSYVQKRKTPQGFADYQNDDSISTNRKSSEYAPANSSKRRKSLDRPQTTTSPRVAPSGKLCYVRESHMFLRYFDDTQVELFIKNLSSQDEELLRTTGIDPEKIKNSYKHSNFGLEQLGKTEILRLPRDIEFSRKEDLPDVEEFVKESSLVEKFVPQDFADFYRYVTGFQIIKNKHPVSLQTFLTMYNTNRTTELLRKYLQRRDEESFGAIAR